MAYKQFIFYLLISTIFGASLDPLTFSNYDTVSISNLTGIFEVDFENKIVKGDLIYYFNCLQEDSQIKLDTKNLNIEKVIKIEKNGEQKELDIAYGDEDDNLGKSLNISFEEKFNIDDEIVINIKYSTTEEGNSAQFLTEEQTIGKQNPFFFTVSKMILGRQLLPSQDTPAQKFPFYLGIKVPNNFRGLISGILDKEEPEGDKTIYYYMQEHPVPNYLISLAAGNIGQYEISENITVYCEPEFNETALEVLDNFEELYNATIDYLGEHVWGKFNILVLPNSFPYSAIENPYLALCSQCLFDKDKSLVDVILNQLIHDWAGNLVTNDNWSDYWLSAGISVFIKRKILGLLKGSDYAKADATIGLVYIYGWSEYFENNTFSTLRPNFTGVNPDDYYSDIPNEKGFNFMYYIETLIGEENMKKFLKEFFSENQFKSINVNDFQRNLEDFCQKNELYDKFTEIEWNRWLYEGGQCPVDNQLKNNKYQEEVNIALDKFYEDDADINEELIRNISSWNHLSKINFILTLETMDDFLSDKQHDIFTNKLQFYKNQDFIVSSNYFRMMLSRTDKFYEHELEYLEKYLSTYGSFDYLAGTYEAFYKRDEVESLRLFNSLKTFYHPIFIANVQEEFNYQIANFPILTIDLKEKDKCIYLNKNKLDLYVEEFDNFPDFTNYEIDEGIYLEIDNEKIKVHCSLNTDEKYCLLEGEKNIEKSGEYILNIPTRIQKLDYAIKVHSSKTKIYTKQSEVDKEKTKASFEINYANNPKQNIEIHFVSEPDDKISVLSGNKNVRCEKNGLILKCEIDKDIFDVNKNNPKEYKTYVLKIVDLCGEEKYSFNVKVKNYKDSKESGLKVWQIILIVLASLIVVIIIAFLIYRFLHKKSNESSFNSEENNSKKLLTEM